MPLANVWWVCSDSTDTWAHPQGAGHSWGKGVKPWRDLFPKGAKPKAPGHTGQVKPAGNTCPARGPRPQCSHPKMQGPGPLAVQWHPDHRGPAGPSPGRQVPTPGQELCCRKRGEDAEEPP